MPDKTYVVGDTLDVGTEADHQERYRQGQVSYEITLDGRMVKPSYYPIHKGQNGSNPAFSDLARHVVTCTAVDADGTTHMLCTCGLRYSFNHSK